MSRTSLWIIAAVVAAAAATWLLLPRASGTTSTRRTEQPIAASAPESAPSPANTPSGADGGGSDAPATATAIAAAAASLFYPPLSGAGDEATLRERPPVEQILTPTSEDDAAWMQRALYPKREDLEAADVARWERLLAEGDPVRDRDALAYAANVLAAHYFRSGDERWREYTRQSLGPFPAMLELADGKMRFEAGRAEPRELARLLARAQVLGEPDATRVFEQSRVTPPRIDGLLFAELVREQVRMLERLNREAIRRGERPYYTAPRPPAPWDGGP